MSTMQCASFSISWLSDQMFCACVIALHPDLRCVSACLPALRTPEQLNVKLFHIYEILFLHL